jgi:glyceraldehyde-3-phosphate dehydrogenase/erythrose-4-phosphate dehydrogenase
MNGYVKTSKSGSVTALTTPIIYRRVIDNEWGYSNKVLMLIEHMSKVDHA